MSHMDHEFVAALEVVAGVHSRPSAVKYLLPAGRAFLQPGHIRVVGRGIDIGHVIVVGGLPVIELEIKIQRPL